MLLNTNDIIIIGAGCVGQVFSAAFLLSNSSNRVFLIPSGISFDDVKINGIKIDGAIKAEFKSSEKLIIMKDIRKRHVKEFNISKEVIVFIATNSWKAVTSLLAIRDVLFYLKPIVICLQNGIGIEEELRNALTLFNVDVLKGQIFSAMHRKDDKIFSYPGTVIIESHKEKNALLHSIFGKKEDCIFRLDLSTSILQSIYQKIVINCVCNPLTVIFNENLGRLCSRYYFLIEAICQELHQLSVLLNLKNQSVSILVDNVLIAMSDFSEHYSSMYIDIKYARMTEIDEINGALVELAKKHAYEMPLNTLLVATIKKIEQFRSECSSQAEFYERYTLFLDAAKENLLSYTSN